MECPSQQNTERTSTRSMECYDPFKEYFVLCHSLRTDLVEDVPHQSSSEDVDFTVKGNSSLLQKNESARPLLGRRSEEKRTDHSDFGMSHLPGESTFSSYTATVTRNENDAINSGTVSRNTHMGLGAPSVHTTNVGFGTPISLFGEASCNGGVLSTPLSISVPTTSPPIWSTGCESPTNHLYELSQPQTSTDSVDLKIPSIQSNFPGNYTSTGFYYDNDCNSNSFSDLNSCSSISPQTVGHRAEQLPSPPFHGQLTSHNTDYYSTDGLLFQNRDHCHGKKFAVLLQQLLQNSGHQCTSSNDAAGYRNGRTLDEGKHCAFCKRNRETREFYSTHVVKDSRGKVICPILRKYVCPVCMATGDHAHTLRHCPIKNRAELLSMTS